MFKKLMDVYYALTTLAGVLPTLLHDLKSSMMRKVFLASITGEVREVWRFPNVLSKTARMEPWAGRLVLWSFLV